MKMSLKLVSYLISSLAMKTTKQGHILKENSSLASNITPINSFDCFLTPEDNQRALLFCRIITGEVRGELFLKIHCINNSC